MGVEKDLKITAVMRRLNRVIHRSGLTSRFVSLLYGEVEAGGNVAYTNAGHEPGLVIRGGGEVESMPSTGIVMGPLEEAEYGRRMLQLRPGDALVLYSDGVVERRSREDEEFGLHRLKRELLEGMEAGLDARALCDRILDGIRAFGGGSPLEDDVTILVVRRVSS
jgi:sigma-B regulation protein RsbU (phosphoserine phosphatase)